MDYDKILVECDDCGQNVPQYQTEIVVAGPPHRACTDCFAKNWRPCFQCNERIRIKHYREIPASQDKVAEGSNPSEQFTVDAVWRDNEVLDDGTYLDYMCRTCIEKLKPVLDFFNGADKEMLRKCRAFLAEH